MPGDSFVVAGNRLFLVFGQFTAEIVIQSHFGNFIFDLLNCFTTTFLHTRHDLLAKLGRWGWLMRFMAWKKSQKTLDS